MEPPQIAALTLTILSSAALFVLASYEATLGVLPRSSLEKMRDTGVPRANQILRVHEPRYRLLLISRLGQGFCTVALTLSLYYLLRFHLDAKWSALAVTAAASLCLLLASTARRVRFEPEGEEPRIPALTLLYIPLHLLLGPLAAVMQRIAAVDYSDEEFKAQKEEELRSLVDSEGETGVLDEGERDMIQGVFGFHDRVAREVMVPRVDITAVEIGGSVADLLSTIRGQGHSRVPVYEESLDSILGILYAKDLLRLLDGPNAVDGESPMRRLLNEVPTGDGEGFQLLHEPFYVPETRKIDQLLRDLRQARTRLAIVVDEYGGTAGLVTTEDLVEEIVGELQDEYDAEETLYHWQPDEVLIVNPRINIEELNELLDSDLPSDGFDTLGGFIYDHLGHVPGAGQSILVPGFEITILAVDGQRISEVQMQRRPNGDSAPDGSPPDSRE